MMRQKYVNILEEFYIKDTHFKTSVGRNSNVTNYCSQKVISKVAILILKRVASNE